MRYLAFVLSALWLIARAIAHHARRRGNRVRRYAAEPPAPRPHVITGPIPLILPSQTTGTVAPPLPALKALPWKTSAPVPVDVLCANRSRARRPGRHRAVAA